MYLVLYKNRGKVQAVATKHLPQHEDVEALPHAVRVVCKTTYVEVHVGRTQHVAMVSEQEYRTLAMLPLVTERPHHGKYMPMCAVALYDRLLGR